MRGDGREVAESHGLVHSELQAGQILEERHRLRAPDRDGRYAVAVSLQNGSDGQALPIVRRPPGLEETPNRPVFESLWVRVG